MVRLKLGPVELTFGKKKLATTPIVQVTEGMKAIFVDDKKKNRYARHRELMAKDSELQAAVNRLALMCQHAYKGIIVRAGHELDEKEKNLLKAAQFFEDKIDFTDLFYVIGLHLIRDGDDVWVSHSESQAGITQLQPLPMEKTTAVKDQAQVGQAVVDSAGTVIMVQNPNLYILNEKAGEPTRQVFPENDNQKIWHFALNNRAEIITDTMGRQTFGVWSPCPLDTLKDKVLWKQLILLTDALTRNKMIPREVFKVDMSAFAEENFEGETLEDRLTAARKAAEAYGKAVAKDFGEVPAGRGYVIDKESEIDVMEPKTQGPTAEDNVQQRINQSISNALGFEYERGTFASELVALSYAVLLPERIVYKIKRMLLEMTKEHIRVLHGETYTKEDLDKLDLKTSLILDILRAEVVRMVAVLSSTGIATRQELRALLEWDPLLEGEEPHVPPSRRGREGDFVQSPEDIARDQRDRINPREPITPESRADKQET